MPEIATVVCM